MWTKPAIHNRSQVQAINSPDGIVYGMTEIHKRKN